MLENGHETETMTAGNAEFGSRERKESKIRDLFIIMETKLRSSKQLKRRNVWAGKGFHKQENARLPLHWFIFWDNKKSQAPQKWRM